VKLSFRRDLALAAVVILGVVVVVSVAPPPDADRLSGESHNFAHVVVFGALGLVLARALRRFPFRRPGWPLVAFATLLAGVGFGILTEYAQGHLGGTPTWGDVSRDVLGTALGLCAAIALARPTAPTARRLLWITVALGLLAAAVPLADAGLDYRARARLFPVLLDPAAPRGLAFVSLYGNPVTRVPLPPGIASGEPAGSTGSVEPGPWTLRVPLDAGRWPGITLDEPAPDWRGWRAIVVEVANPSDEPLDLTLRVNDRAHDNRSEDRYNQHLPLQPRSRHRFEFPLEAVARAPAGRAMDLSQIQKVIVFHVGPAPGRSFHLERIALVR
jgi:VanZ family protein